MMNFIAKIMSPQTARFILALLALGCSAYGANKLLVDTGKEAGQASIFAIGQLFALATMAFGYYFGSTAKGDANNQRVEVSNTQENPVPTENQETEK